MAKCSRPWRNTWSSTAYSKPAQCAVPIRARLSLDVCREVPDSNELLFLPRKLPGWYNQAAAGSCLTYRFGRCSMSATGRPHPGRNPRLGLGADNSPLPRGGSGTDRQAGFRSQLPHPGHISGWVLATALCHAEEDTSIGRLAFALNCRTQATFRAGCWQQPSATRRKIHR